ncbi:MAG: hypothetical protein HPY53_01310 [Brevinematales bacterium]|nr:hypothetical protein [Brevinematales bacterium]
MKKMQLVFLLFMVVIPACVNMNTYNAKPENVVKPTLYHVDYDPWIGYYFELPLYQYLCFTAAEENDFIGDISENEDLIMFDVYKTIYQEELKNEGY